MTKVRQLEPAEAGQRHPRVPDDEIVYRNNAVIRHIEDMIQSSNTALPGQFMVALASMGNTR